MHFTLNNVFHYFLKNSFFYKRLFLLINLCCWVLLLGGLNANATLQTPTKLLQVHIIKSNKNIFDNNVLLALDINIPDGWILEFVQPNYLIQSPPHNLKKISLGLTKQKTFTVFGIKIKGYKNHVILPVLLKLKTVKSMQMHLILRGTLCSNVCVLFQHSIQFPLIKGNNIPTKQNDFVHDLAYKTKLISFLTHKISTIHSKDQFSAQHSLLWAFAVAFFIGIILNIFPCIFPTLVFKIQSSKEKYMHGKWIFSAGVLTSFILLGLIVALLKDTFFWGEQFHSSWALFIIATIFAIFGLLNFSNFKIAFLESQFFHTNKLFLGGMLSVFIGISCSVPLLGSLLIVAFSFSFLTIILLFTTMGIGLILPYITLISPLLQKIFNKYPQISKKNKMITGVLFFILSLIFFWIAVMSLTSTSDTAKNKIQSIPFVQSHYKKVLVDITADWCVTCQINSIYLKKINTFLEKQQIHIITLDYTQSNKYIKRYLLKYHSSVLPTFIYYSDICKNGKKLNVVFLSKHILTTAC